MADGQPQTPNVAGMVADPDFQGLAPADKRAALGKLTGDTSFGGLSDAETMQFISRFATPKSSPITDKSSLSAPKPSLDAVSPLDFITGGSLLNPIRKYVTEAQNLTQEGQAAQPIKAAIGKAAGIAFGGSQGIGKKQGGIVTNPLLVTIATLGIGGAAEAVASKIPSAERAGMAINKIVSGSKSLAVPVFDASAEAMRAKEIAQTSSIQLPSGVSKFLRRVMDPDKPPLTLDEARDFYSGASKITAKEWSELSGPMKRQIATWTKALGENIESALNTAKPGEGTALRSAMDEYHNAMALKAAGVKTLKAGGAALGATALGGAAYSGWHYLKSLIGGK